ncbi:MDIS1-interacting receptor like kinase 2-like [Punica granatum]|uniref:MDIS1-interacting receptor like kinase 2-like n=2 Tax=Punica granatum TaxID=22663 RepID=A0A6P8CMQ1_PUNGR|nr:MDIS1-interacting receptor like kinase 2-like [Punica granatum]
MEVETISLFPSPSSASVQEDTALLRWKSSLKNQNRSDSSLASWTNATAGPCLLLGILCDADLTIKGVNLTNMSVSGTLYEFPFDSLLNLTYIDMCLNNLSGSIPREIRLLTKLKYLDLSFNMLSGKIPEEFGKLGAMTRMNMSNNRLSGGIPSEIGDLSNLLNLDLLRNMWTSIPNSIKKISQLYYLDLSHNQLRQEIPPAIG